MSSEPLQYETVTIDGTHYRAAGRSASGRFQHYEYWNPKFGWRTLRNHNSRDRVVEALRGMPCLDFMGNVVSDSAPPETDRAQLKGAASAPERDVP